VELSRFEYGPGRWLFTVEGTGDQAGLRFDWPLLAICVVLSAALLRWLLLHKQQDPDPPAALTDSTAPPCHNPNTNIDLEGIPRDSNDTRDK
jgi:hypothetical protein